MMSSVIRSVIVMDVIIRLSFLVILCVIFGVLMIVILCLYWMVVSS